MYSHLGQVQPGTLLKKNNTQSKTRTTNAMLVVSIYHIQVDCQKKKGKSLTNHLDDLNCGRSLRHQLYLYGYIRISKKGHDY